MNHHGMKVRTKPAGILRVGERIEVFVVVNSKPFYRWEPVLEKETVGVKKSDVQIRTANARLHYPSTKLLRYLPGEEGIQQ